MKFEKAQKGADVKKTDGDGISRQDGAEKKYIMNAAEKKYSSDACNGKLKSGSEKHGKVKKIFSLALALSLAVSMFTAESVTEKNGSGVLNPVVVYGAAEASSSDSENGGSPDGRQSTVSYNFQNQDAGNACGTISVTVSKPGDYSLRWGDGSGNALKYKGVEFDALGTVSASSSNLSATYKVTSPYTAIPAGAKELLLTDKDNKTDAVCSIPQDKLFPAETEKYEFALMSDVHFNRYSDFSEDDAVPAFDNALRFINDLGVNTLFMTGDLSNQGEIDSYNKFNTAIGRYPGLTVYTCMGNHDVSWIGSAQQHVKLFAGNVNTKRKTDPNVTDEAKNGVDFVYQKGGDVHIFFSQTGAQYGISRTIVSDDQLNWLEKTLNKYADRKVYLYFHTYFAADGGDVTRAVGNLITPPGYTYDLTYPYGAKDEKRFRSILKKYANVTMFSGHSHWAFEEQIYNSALNIGNISASGNGASLVHIASVSAPRTAVLDKKLYESGTVRYENNGVKSEGMIAARYSDMTVYYGVDFVNKKIMTAASYIDKDGAKSAPVPAIKTGKTKITGTGRVRRIKKSSKKHPKYKIRIRFKKVPGSVRYQIQYSTSRKFKASKTVTRYTKKHKYTVTKLKAGRRYYVRVRAYRTQFGERIYGKFGKIKKIKTPEVKRRRAGRHN